MDSNMVTIAPPKSAIAGCPPELCSFWYKKNRGVRLSFFNMEKSWFDDSLLSGNGRFYPYKGEDRHQIGDKGLLYP
ncbi:MAG: hypothetical protein HC925_00535 [Coleofasciculaceae cyanobacterium SM2_3_26]|nr:hypothetical protein [Coleofasciculaceae cyanobacterium SM2_3_26]